MRLLLAIFLPFTVFFIMGRPGSAILALLIQLSGAGWPFAAVWAVYSLGQFETDEKIESALAKQQDRHSSDSHT